MIKSLLFTLSFVASSTGKATLNGNKLTFLTNENKLPWPLPDLYDPGILIYHGVHCFMKMQEFKKNKPIDVKHRHHCRQSMATVLRLLQSDRLHYQATQWVCDLLEKNRQLSKAHYQTFDVFDYGDEYQIPEPGITFLQDPSKPHDPIAHAVTQYHAYVILATDNFAKLIFDNMTDPGLLTKEEQEYLGLMESDLSIGFQALGVYCRVDGNLEEIRKALSKSAAVDKDRIDGVVQGP